MNDDDRPADAPYAAPYGPLYQDSVLIAVNKPVGMPVENDASGDPSLFDAVRYELHRLRPGHRPFLGVVHRIDRPVAGVVIFALTPETLRRLHAAFRERRVRKIYWAIVEGTLPLPEGRLEDYLSSDSRSNKAHVYPAAGPNRKPARLAYRVVGRSQRYTFVEVELHTGRHHQIRAQLAHAGAAIKGDLKYGARRSNPGGGISLFARELGLRHPFSGEELRLVAEPPDETLWNLFPRS